MPLDYPRTLEDGLLEALTLDGGETKIKVQASVTGGSSSEYDEGETDAVLTGPVIMAEGDADTVRPVQVLELAGGNAVKTAIVDASGAQITSFGGGAQYTEGDIDASITGTAALMETGSNTLEVIQGTVADGLLVNLGSNNDVTVTGTVTATDGGGSITVDGSVTVSATDLDIRDLAFATDAVDVSGSSVVVTDGGGSVTVDGSVTVTATNLDVRDLAFATDKVDVTGSAVTVSGSVAITAAALPLPSGAATAALQTQPGVDIGDVTVNNGSGASAVNIQDGGNSITIDGTVAVSGSVAVTNAALSVVGGGAEATALRVTVANDSTGVLSVDDNGASLTVDGTVAATQSGAWNITNISGTVSLPTGAATSALQTQPGVDIGDVTINNASGASAVNVQDGGNSLSVDDGGGSITVDGSVSLTGSVDTELTTADLDTGAGTDTRAVVGMVLAASGGGVLVGTANPMPVSDNSGSLTVDNAALSVVGTGTEAAALRVTIATDSTGVLSVDDNGGSLTVDGTVAATQSGTWNVTNVSGTVSLPTGAATETTSAAILALFKSATATLANVSASASSVTLLASNASRESAVLVNDSTVVCFVKFGTTASSTSFTYLMNPGDTLILDSTGMYTGIITGIWASATGSMRVTEMTA